MDYMINLDFKKYKRVFTFGCSFTQYIWPTWADLIFKETPQAELYNFGRSGAGNLMISLRVAEVHQRFKFDENDLVMIMWSTHTREDRWMRGSWQPQGNIFNQGLYPKDWVKKFADVNGYAIRDMAIFSLTHNYLKSINCDKLEMMSYPLNVYESALDIFDVTDVYTRLMQVYGDEYSLYPPSMLDTIGVGYVKCLPVSHTYIWGSGKDAHSLSDNHPHPLAYHKYLSTIGVPLTEISYNYAHSSTLEIFSCTTKDEIISKFPEEDKQCDLSRQLLF